MTTSALEMLERWQQFAKERRAFDVSVQMMALTLRIVGKALLSIDISGEAGEIARALTDAQEHFAHFRLGTLLPFPTPENRRFRAAIKPWIESCVKLSTLAVTTRRRTMTCSPNCWRRAIPRPVCRWTILKYATK